MLCHTRVHGKKWVSKKFKTFLQDFCIHSCSSVLHCRCREHWLAGLTVDNLAQKLPPLKSKMLMNAHYHALDLSPFPRFSAKPSFPSCHIRLRWHWLSRGESNATSLMQVFMYHFHGEKCCWCMPSAHNPFFSAYIWTAWHHSAWLSLPFTEFYLSVLLVKPR